jgi:copper transport protein
MKRLLLLLGALFSVGFLFATPALAHATLVASDPADGARLPAAPRAVTLTFDENVGIGDIGYLHVTDHAGQRVDAGNAYHPNGDGTKVADPLESGLGDGTYTASFRVLSADSHPIAGSIAFVVGNGPLVKGPATAGGAVDPVTGDAFDVARWISYAGLVLFGGSWLIFTIWPAGRDDARARRIVWFGWLGLAVGAGLELVLQGPYTAGEGLRQVFSGSLLNDTLHTDYGQLHSARLLFLGALALLLTVTLQSGAKRSASDGYAAILGGVVVWTFSRSGHAATTDPSWFSVSVDMVHLLAVAAWLGGLVMLVFAVLPRRDADELRVVLPTFSSVAMGAVALLVASGTYSAWRGIGTVHAIFSTTYGLIVVGKIALLAGILGIANLSRRLVQQRVVAYAMTDAVLQQKPDRQDELRVERLRRAVAVEAVAGLVVLAFSAVLVAEPRGKEALLTAYRDPVLTTAPLGHGQHLDITASTGVHGPVTFTVMLSNHREARITATAAQHDKQIGPLPIKLARAGTGHYEGTVVLPVAGTWELDFVVTTSRFDATTTDTTIDLH